MKMTNDEKDELTSMISRIVENVHSDLEAAVQASEPDARLTGDDFVEPVYNHLINDVTREFGVSHEISQAVRRYDKEVSALITKVAKSIVGG